MESKGFTDTHKNQIKETIRDELDSLRARVSLTKEAAVKLSIQALPKSGLQTQVLELIADSDQPVTALEISEKINMSRSAIYRTLHRLSERGAILESEKLVPNGDSSSNVKCFTINTL